MEKFILWIIIAILFILIYSAGFLSGMRSEQMQYIKEYNLQFKATTGEMI